MCILNRGHAGKNRLAGAACGGGFAGIKGLLEPPRKSAGYRRANLLYWRGEYRGCIDAARKVLEEMPSFHHAHVLIGKAHLKLGEWAQAEKEFRKAVEANPRSSIGLTWLAHMRIRQKRYREALRFAKGALSVNARSPFGHYYAGVSEFKLGNYELALMSLLKSIEVGGCAMSPHTYIMMAYVHIGKIELALAHYEEEKKNNPENVAECSSFLAKAFLRARRLDDAIKYYGIVISLKPESGFSYNERGRAHLFKSEYGRALLDFEAAARLMPESYFPYKNMGIAQYCLGFYADAIKSLSAAARISKGAESIYYLAKAHDRMGEYAEFAECIRMAVELEKNPEKKAKYEMEHEAVESLRNGHITREYLVDYLRVQINGGKEKRGIFRALGKKNR